jgi:hypothetical protein
MCEWHRNRNVWKDKMKDNMKMFLEVISKITHECQYIWAQRQTEGGTEKYAAGDRRPRQDVKTHGSCPTFPQWAGVVSSLTDWQC